MSPKEQLAKRWIKAWNSYHGTCFPTNDDYIFGWSNGYTIAFMLRSIEKMRRNR